MMHRHQFDLFISYARSDCFREFGGHIVSVVEELKGYLESHTHPDEPKRRFRVCTDVDDLELDGTVSAAIRAKIERSDHLLIVCSGSAPARQYIAEEIRTFQLFRPDVALLSAYLDLQPEDALPALFAPGTIGADIRPRAGATLRGFRQQLERESHKVVARAWGIPVERVFDRFRAESRRRRRLTVGGIAAALATTFAGVLIAAGDWGLHAVRELPLGTRVVAPTGVGFVDAKQEALLVGKSIVSWSVEKREGAVVRLSVPYPRDVFVFRDGRILLLETSGLTLVSPAGRRTTIATPIEGDSMAVMGESIAVISEAGELVVGNLRGNWRHAPRPRTTTLRWAPPDFQERGPLRYGDTLAWSRDGKWLASATATGQLMVVSPGSWRFLKANDPIVYETRDTRPIGAMLFLTNPDRLLFSEGSDGLRQVDLRTAAIKPILLPQLPLIRELELDERHDVLIGATSETLEIFDVDGDALRWRDRVSIAPKSIPRMALSESGDTLFVGYFDAPPDLFRWTWRVFGLDVWTRRG